MVEVAGGPEDVDMDCDAPVSVDGGEEISCWEICVVRGVEPVGFSVFA